MKKISLVIVLILLFSFSLFAQTPVPGGNVNGTWNLAGSPYIVNGNIQIIVGDQLTIDPGVVIQFSDHYKFEIFGRLLAEGTSGNMITFSAQNPATGWHGLRFIDTNANLQDSSKIVYCEIEDGKATGTSPDYRGGGIYCSNSSDILIKNSTISNNTALSNGGGIYLYQSDVIFDNVIIADNTASGSGGGMYLYQSDVVLTEVIVSGNSSTYDGGGINCYLSNPVMTHCQLYDNTTEWNGGGIYFFYNSSPEIVNCTFSNNIADQFGSALAVLYSSDVTLQNCIIWDNATNGIYVESGSSLSATYSDIMNGTGQGFFGIGCIDEDPLFADPSNNDYQLTWADFPIPNSTKSPCIDTGDPASAPDSDGTRVDMGALPYLQSGISGTITLQGGVGNILDVVVTAYSATDTIVTSPDEDGTYIVNVIPGTYTVTAALDGYSADPVTGIIVASGQVTSGVDIILNEILPGEIKGTVDLEGLGNVTEVVVSAGGESTNPYPVYDPFSGNILYYEYIIELTQGTYDVTAIKAGYQDSTITGVVVASGQQTTGINFVLQLIKYDGWISGTVTLKGGTGDVTNVEVTADTVTVNPDASGYYEIILNNGTYDITATLDHYTSVGFEDVEVIANDTTSIDFTLLPWEIIPGTQFAMIEYITASLDGKYVQNVGSNKVGAFGSGGTTDCRGIATWQEGNHPLWKGCYPLEGYWYMTIVSDYNAGNDTINFKLYDTETDSIYDCYETIIFVDCDTAQVDIIAQNEVDQNFSFTENWNWISFNVHPANTSISSVFDPIKAEMVQVKNQSTSATYFDPPGTWQGELTNIADAEGYLLYTPTSVSSYTLSGYRINPETHPIVLTTGCNWIGYLPNEELELDDAVQCLSVLDSLVYIKTQQRSAVYYNGGWVGDLLTMNPGVGYKIKTLAAKDTLTYPIVESSKGTSVVAHTNNPLGWKVLSGCAQNMIAIVNPKNLQDPSTLSMGVFDEDRTCYSIGSYTNDVWYFTVVGQDIHELHFEAYHTENGAYYTSSEKFSFQNDNILGKVSEPYEITLEKIQHNVPIIELKQNTPNPFKSSTSIHYYIPEPSHVEISVYNILGQKVTTLLSTHKESGEYVLTWNGLDENGTRLSSGIYFYKLMTDSFSNVKKMLIIQ